MAYDGPCGEWNLSFPKASDKMKSVPNKYFNKEPGGLKIWLISQASFSKGKNLA